MGAWNEREHADCGGGPGDLLHHLRWVRLRGGEPEHRGHGDVPGHLRRVGARGDWAETFLVGFFFALAHSQAHYGCVDELGADLGPSDRGRPVQEHLGVHGWAGVRDGGGSVGLQPGPLHRQAAARDHQERLVPQ